VGTKAGDVGGDEPDGNGDFLGAREVGRGCFGEGATAVAADLAGGAAPLFGRAGVMVSDRRQLEDREEGNENDRRSSCAQQALEEATRKGSTRHWKRG
jgi:hypothetical protein